MAEEKIEKKKGGKGKFFLGAALGAVAGIFAGRAIAKKAKEDECECGDDCECDDKCECSDECECKKEEPKTEKSEKSEKKSAKKDA